MGRKRKTEQPATEVDGEEQHGGRSNGTEIPLNIRKIIAAINDKKLQRKEVQRRAGWWPSKIHGWETRCGELSVEDAWKAADAVDIPLNYIADDTIPLTSPPPTRQMYDNSALLERARSLNLDAGELIEGMFLISLVKRLGIGLDLATTMLSDGAAERKGVVGQVIDPINPTRPRGIDDIRKGKGNKGG